MEHILLITGASSDLGMAFIRENEAQYEKIIAHFRSGNEQFEMLKRTLEDKILPIQADFAKEEEVTRFAESLKESGFVPTQVLHLAALPAASVKFHKSDIDVYKAMMQVSVYSIVEILKTCIPMMQKQKYGRVLFMLSAYTTISDPKYAAPYVASKYALLGVMKDLAAEYASKGITVNGISPQMIETKFLSGVPELIIEQQRQAGPLGRLLRTEDILPMIKVLLSEDAAAITGENISVTGGNYIL